MKRAETRNMCFFTWPYTDKDNKAWMENEGAQYPSHNLRALHTITAVRSLNLHMQADDYLSLEAKRSTMHDVIASKNAVLIR